MFLHNFVPILIQKYSQFWTINIIIPNGDSNLGLQLPTCVNIVDDLNRSATTACFLVFIHTTISD